METIITTTILLSLWIIYELVMSYREAHEKKQKQNEKTIKKILERY